MYLRNILAYCAFRGPDNEQDVYVMPVKGGKEVRLTDAQECSIPSKHPRQSKIDDISLNAGY